MSRLLCDQLSDERFEHINIGELVNNKHLYKSWNERFDVPEFDEDMICDALEQKISVGGLIIDFHTSSFFPRDWFDLIVVLRADNTVLYDRLSEKGYSQDKISENIQCEIFNVVSEEVHEAFAADIIIELESTEASQVEENIEKIRQRLSN